MELQYIKLGIKPLKKLWERFDSRQQAHKLETEKHHEYTNPISFSSWLPSFYDEVLLYLEQEWKWYDFILIWNFLLGEITVYLLELLMYQLLTLYICELGRNYVDRYVKVQLVLILIHHTILLYKQKTLFVAYTYR